MSNDLDIANRSLRDIAETPTPNFNPAIEVSTTIISLISKITNRFDVEDTFNERLKTSLLARLPEAQWSEIASLLSQREMNENIRLKELLLPFIPKDGDRIPLLDTERREQHSDSVLSGKASKDMLQSVETLRLLFSELKKKKDALNANTTDISVVDTSQH